MTAFRIDRRSTLQELMDTETVPFEDFRDCLKDLSSVNRISFGYRPTLSFLERFVGDGRLPEGRPLRVLDVGSGYGDTLRAIALWAGRRGIPVALTGVDLNPWSTRAAREATPDDLPVRFVTGDAFAFRPDHPPDLVISALFTHHLDDAALVRFLEWMEEEAALGWFVNDLHRDPVAYHGFRAIATAARWHRFVRHDGPLSIARGFRREDWSRLLVAAGLAARGVSIEWWLPYRLCLGRVK
ncbi:methyltransferase domain-containing protein [Chthonobacter rhizosphaerae]|uniref:methyltransferase domain-containing protein n=1 Tax=Chthonobacter rhizosphaerae TaxID=2735553 RepID=UPI0015EED1E0|nr:methyltransferase domain-containing protein [Chthonobacter rhizosphaerae]